MEANIFNGTNVLNAVLKVIVFLLISFLGMVVISAIFKLFGIIA